MTRRLAAKVVSATVLLLLSAGYALAEPALKLRRDNVSLRLANGAYRGRVLVDGTGIDANAKGELTVKAAGDVPAHLDVQFGPVTQLQRGAARVWDVTVTAAGMRSNDEAPDLHAGFVLDGEPSGVAKFSLSSKEQGAFQWHAVPDGKNVLLDDDEVDVSFVLYAPSRGASDVRLAGSSLQNAETKAAIETDSIKLIDPTHEVDKPTTAGDAQSIQVPAQGSKGLELWVTQPDAAGEYTGVIHLTTPETPTPLAFNLTLYVTSAADRLAGLACIAVGVGVFWLSVVYAGNRRNRLELLGAAARLAERAQDHEQIRVEAATSSNTSLLDSQAFIDGIRKELDTEFLDGKGLIPPRVPFGVFDDKPFQAHVAKLAQRLAVLDIAVSYGMRRALDLKPKPEDLEKALQALDSLLKNPDVSKPEQIRKDVDAILAAIPTLRASAAGPAALQSGPPNLGSILMSLERLNVLMWLIWLVLTVVTGWAVLILTNPAFGSAQDLAKCFFWGLGVITASGGLSDLTRPKIDQKIKIEMS